MLILHIEITMIHLPFENRLEAGRALATELHARGIPQDSVILSLARGGVPVGFEVADRLYLQLDVLSARKIDVPWQHELTIGAIAGKTCVLDERSIAQLNLSADDLQEIVSREEWEMRRREEFYRSGLPPRDLRTKTVVIVDEGLASGNTALAAIRHLKGQRLLRTILAVPVASRNGYDRVRGEVDNVICLALPEHFYAIGACYREFPRVTDLNVKSLLMQAHNTFLRKSSLVTG